MAARSEGKVLDKSSAARAPALVLVTNSGWFKLPHEGKGRELARIEVVGCRNRVKMYAQFAVSKQGSLQIRLIRA